jgi:hypothetical protein
MDRERTSVNTNKRQRTSTKGETRFNSISPEIVEGMQKRRFEKAKAIFQLPGVPAGDYVLVPFLAPNGIVARR